jgi:hypothetical protein
LAADTAFQDPDYGTPPQIAQGEAPVIRFIHHMGIGDVYHPVAYFFPGKGGG